MMVQSLLQKFLLRGLARHFRALVAVDDFTDYTLARVCSRDAFNALRPPRPHIEQRAVSYFP